MKRRYLILITVLILGVNAFADIPSPNRTPRPTPKVHKVVVNTTTPTPAPVKVVPAEYDGVIRVYVDRSGKIDVPVLEVRQSAVERLIAANLEGNGGETFAAGSSPGFSATQTIVSGALFSLAFIVGGIWIFRSKGNSKTAAGILLGVALGAGTMVLANSPPPSAVTLTSRIFNKSTLAYGYAKNKVKIKLVPEKDYIDGEARDDVVLIVPGVEGEGGE
jgi:hypothetical protein